MNMDELSYGRTITLSSFHWPFSYNKKNLGVLVVGDPATFQEIVTSRMAVSSSMI
jgi:hypothetical protein